MKQAPRLIICGNYGASNLGDEAILDGILTVLLAASPQSKIIVLSANPEETAQVHKVESASFLPTGFRSFFRSLSGGLRKTIQVFRNADGFILGGGGLFTDEKLRAILIWFLQAKLALIFNKPLFCLGQSVGPLKTPLGRFFTKRIFLKANYVLVRDSSSAELLLQLDIKNVEALADNAFCLAVEKSISVEREKFVVLSIRPWLKGEFSDQHQILAKFIDWLFVKHGLKTICVPFQTLQDDDRQAFQDIVKNVQDSNTVQVFSEALDYKKAIEIIGEAQAVIGMRLHSIIFSTLMTTPFLALSYSQKVSSFVESLEFRDYLLEWKNLSLKALQENFEKMEKNRGDIQKKLSVKRERQRLEVNKSIPLLKKFIENL